MDSVRANLEFRRRLRHLCAHAMDRGVSPDQIVRSLEALLQEARESKYTSTPEQSFRPKS